MSLFNETPRSLGIYFAFAGVIGFLMDVSAFGQDFVLPPFSKAVVISDMIVCLVYMYVGGGLKTLLNNGSELPIRILYANFAVILCATIINPYFIGKAIVSAFFTYYLMSNLKRLKLLGVI